MFVANIIEFVLSLLSSTTKRTTKTPPRGVVAAANQTMPQTKCVRYRATTTDDVTYVIARATTTSNALKSTKEQYDCYFIDTWNKNIIVILNRLTIPHITCYTSIKRNIDADLNKILGWLDFTSEESKLLKSEGFTDFEDFVSTTKDDLKSMIDEF